MNTIIGHSANYTMLFIPVGIVFFILIKFGSDFSKSNRGLVVYSNNKYENLLIDKEKLVGFLDEAFDANNKIFMIKNLPIKANEIKFDTYGVAKPLGEIDYVSFLIDLEGFAKAFKGMFCTESYDDYSRMFIARITYDKFICNGAFSVRKGCTIDEFLDKNHIVQGNSLRVRMLVGNNMKGRITIFNLGLASTQIMDSQKLMFFQGNALFLFLSINRLVDVVNC